MSNTLEELATSWLRLIKSNAKLFGLEAELAKRSLFPFLLSFFLFLILFLGFWFVCILGVGYLVYNHTHDISMSILIDLIITALTALVALFFTLKYLKRLQFKRTRLCLRHNSLEK